MTVPHEPLQEQKQRPVKTGRDIFNELTPRKQKRILRYGCPADIGLVGTKRDVEKCRRYREQKTERGECSKCFARAFSRAYDAETGQPLLRAVRGGYCRPIERRT